MSRVVVAHRNLENYVRKLSKEEQFAFGVVVGQSGIHDKDYVVHLARTPFHEEEETADGEPVKKPESDTKQIDNQLLVNHALSVTRMIPGSFSVLGIFVTSENNVVETNDFPKTAKVVLRQVYEVLTENKQLCGFPTDSSELLFLSYCSSNSSFVCKSLDVKDSSASLKDVDWKFIDKPLIWQKFEANYELDEVFPLIKDEDKINVEENFYNSLGAIGDQITQSIIFIQNENVDESQTVEAYVKDRNSKKEETNSIAASVYLPAIISPTDSSTIGKFEGTVRYTGMVCSRIWVHPKSTLKLVQDFIRRDILRSLASRIQMFVDDQHESAAMATDDITVNEPPRRVFIDVPDSRGIQFSEYIFRGETSEIVIDQAKEILDIEVDSNQIYTDIEALPEFDEDISIFSPTPSTNNVKPQETDVNKTMYMVGIGVALLILILSVVLHLIFR
uniref:Putative conserved plasma membrane protein n=1 Tax=Tabanus bromius TaxID=304241 RepID=A0A0K8TQR3_TABBR